MQAGRANAFHSLISLRPVFMATFSALLGENTFPTLESLDLRKSPDIGDCGLELLVQALLKPACQTCLKELNLYDVNMGDKVMAAMASVARAGRFERLENFLFYGNADVTDEGVCALAQAMEDTGTYGLPMLRNLDARALQSLTALGIRALTSALITNCSHVMLLDFTELAYKKRTRRTCRMSWTRWFGLPIANTVWRSRSSS